MHKQKFLIVVAFWLAIFNIGANRASAVLTLDATTIASDGSLILSPAANGSVGIGSTTAATGLTVANSVSAASNLARGVFINNTLTATANNDALVGIDIRPTFTNGAFTGISNLAARFGTSGVGGGDIQINGTMTGGYGKTISVTTANTIQQNSIVTGAIDNTMLKLINSVRNTSSGSSRSNVFEARLDNQLPSNNVDSQNGIVSSFVNNSAFNMANFTSYNGYIQIPTGTVTTYSMMSNSLFPISGALTNWVGVDFSALQAGTVANYYGLRFGDITGSGLTRALDLSVNSGANKFNVYAGGTASNYFNGSVGIGTTAPTSKLQIVGLPVFANNAAAIAGGLTVGALYRTGADPDPVMIVH